MTPWLGMLFVVGALLLVASSLWDTHLRHAAGLYREIRETRGWVVAVVLAGLLAVVGITLEALALVG